MDGDRVLRNTVVQPGCVEKVLHHQGILFACQLQRGGGGGEVILPCNASTHDTGAVLSVVRWNRKPAYSFPFYTMAQYRKLFIHMWVG